jgi:hypothetical protein
MCAVALVGATVVLAAVPKSGSYSGTSSQGLPVVFGVANGGKLITDFEPEFIAHCTKSGSPDRDTPGITTLAGRNLAIRKDAFAAHGFKGKLDINNTASGDVTDYVAGKFGSSHSANGTYSVQLTLNGSAPDGFAGYHCVTGTLKWTAKRT